MPRDDPVDASDGEMDEFNIGSWRSLRGFASWPNR